MQQNGNNIIILNPKSYREVIFSLKLLLTILQLLLCDLQLSKENKTGKNCLDFTVFYVMSTYTVTVKALVDIVSARQQKELHTQIELVNFELQSHKKKILYKKIWKLIYDEIIN